MLFIGTNLKLCLCLFVCESNIRYTYVISESFLKLRHVLINLKRNTHLFVYLITLFVTELFVKL